VFVVEPAMAEEVTEVFDRHEIVESAECVEADRAVGLDTEVHWAAED